MQRMKFEIHAGAEVAEAAAERQAEEDAEVAEDELLERAAQIRKLRDSLARPAPPAAEPKRPKTHWDHLLEEMTWLAKEFQKSVSNPFCVEESVAAICCMRVRNVTAFAS